jgi:hypothetical protein
VITFSVKAPGIENLADKVGAFDEKSRRALNAAIRGEGYRLMRLMQQQVRRGAPGGRRFAPLSFIARIMRFGRARRHAGQLGRNEPLKALAQAIKYLVPKKDPVEFHFGFVGPVNRSEMRAMNAHASQLISKSWQYIAAQQQAGFTTPFDRVIRRGVSTRAAVFARQGAAQTGKRGVRYSRGRFFFLRKTTQALHTPARPIIAPFWQSEASGVIEHVRENFRKKMAGERF